MLNNQKIFGLGLSRTGTTSLGLALERLDYKTIHFPIDIYSKGDQIIYQKFDAFVDLPIPLYYKALDKQFPGSKFIFTTRDKDKWLASMKWLLTEGCIIWKHGKIHENLHQEVYKTTVYNETALLRAYESYNTSVLEYFKDRSGDFIHLDLEKGELNYDIICNFLGLPMITEIFPRSNEKRKASLWNKIEYYLWRYMPFYKKTRYLFRKYISK